MPRETQASAPQQTARGDRPGTGASPRVILIVMCAGYFLVLLDVTIVNVASAASLALIPGQLHPGRR